MKLMSGSVLLLAAGVLTPSVLAQSSGGDFELTQSTIDAGGGRGTGSNFELVGTVAQPEANPQQSSGGDFLLAGGFWASANETIFSNGFEEN